MPLLSCLLSQKKINAKTEELLKDTKTKNLLLKSKYINNQKSFITLNFSNNNLDSDIDVCKASGVIVNFIGDITNRLELIKLLNLRRDVRNSNLINHAYKKWGDSFPIRIYGFFSIIIYKSREKKLVIVNDHLGSKPIYYYKSADTFLISSKIKTILNLIETKQANNSRIRDYFIFFNGKPGETFFSDVLRLEPGSQIIYQNNKVTKKKYFDYDLTKKIAYKNDREYEENFSELFFNTISALSHSLDGAKIGSSLSGGLDSSSITCSLKYLNKNVIPQSVLFEGLDGHDSRITNERSYVDDISKKYDLNINHIPLKNNGCISEYPKAIKYNDEPPSLINGYIHSAIFENLNNNNINILFDGYDGDTAVSHGYEHLFELGRKFRLIKLLKEYSDIHKLQGIHNPKKFNAIKQYCVKSYIPKKIFWLKDKYLSGSMVPLRWYERLDKNLISPPEYNEIFDNYNGLPIPNLYSKNSQYAHYLDVINPTIEMSLNLINHSACEYGIDIKFPFMDRKIIEFCLSIPSNQKLRNGVSRSILRRSMKNILPDSIINRHDKSDLSPFSRKQICNLSDNKILNSAQNIGFLDVNSIKHNLLSNKSENLMEIYQIIIFDAWLNKNNF